MAVAIRRANAEDAGSIARVHVESWKETYRDIVPESYLNRLNVDERRALWTEAIQRGQNIFIAEKDATLIGFANGGKSRASAIYRGELYAMYVRASYHGQGVGRQLFEAVRRDLAVDGLLPFNTFVLADNPALEFYRHMGGQAVKTHEEDFDGILLKEVEIGWDQ